MSFLFLLGRGSTTNLLSELSLMSLLYDCSLAIIVSIMNHSVNIYITNPRSIKLLFHVSPSRYPCRMKTAAILSMTFLRFLRLTSAAISDFVAATVERRSS